MTESQALSVWGELFAQMLKDLNDEEARDRFNQFDAQCRALGFIGEPHY